MTAGAAAAALGAVVVALACAGCRGRPVDVPAFAAQLPGRTALVAWTDDGREVPASLAQWFAGDVPASLQPASGGAPGDILLARAQSGAALAFRIGDGVRVGYSSLADSGLFHEALAAHGQGSVLLYADFQLLVAAFMAEAQKWAPRGVPVERVAGGLGLRSLRWLLVALWPEGDGWRGRGQLSTSGQESGVPGMLTVSENRSAEPMPRFEPGARLQVDVCCSASVLPRVVWSLTDFDDRAPWASALQGPLQQLDRIVHELDGRITARLDARGRPGMVARVQDEARLRRALARRRGGDLPARLRIDEGWLVLGDAELPEPGPSPPEPGPWARLSARLPLGEGPDWLLEITARRAAEDLVALELRLQPGG